MDLISREAVDNAMYDYCHACDVNESQMENYFCDLPSAFEGMTVGEVMKAVLGIEDEQIVEAKYLVSIYPKGNHYDPFIAIKREVWNSPYQKGE